LTPGNGMMMSLQRIATNGSSWLDFSLAPATPTHNPIPTTTTTSTSTTSTTSTLPGSTIDELLSGQKMGLKDNADPTKRKASVQPADPSITAPNDGSPDDPTNAETVSTLRIKSAAAEFDTGTLPLPAGNWAVIGKPGQNKGFKYADKSLAAGPVGSIQIKPNKQ